MKYTKDELCLIWLDSFMGLEYKHKKDLYEHIVKSPKIRTALERLRDIIERAISKTAYELLLNSATDEYLSELLSGLERRGITCVTIYSKDYPKALENVEIPPLVLYAVGDVSLLNKSLFSIVGSRKSLPQSIALAKEYTISLAEKGEILVTGSAEGIDEVVLRTCLDNGYKVISVVAGGILNVYPSKNKSLIDLVAKSGLVISEYPPEVKPMPYFFPVRNRIIAGLSKGVLVVSGAKDSGALYTAEYAGEYGKDMFAIPYNVGIKSGEGCNELIKKGAILTTEPKDIIEYYGLIKEETEKPLKEELNEDEIRILEILSGGETHVEIIAKGLNKPTYLLIPLLSVLEIKGLIYKNGANFYGRVK